MHWLGFGLAWELCLAQVSLCQDTRNGYSVLSPLQLLLFIPAGPALPLQPSQGSSVRTAWSFPSIASLQDPLERWLGDDREPSTTLVKIFRPLVRGGHVEPGAGRQSATFSVQNVLHLEHPLGSRCYIRAVVINMYCICLYCKYILAPQLCNSEKGG